MRSSYLGTLVRRSRKCVTPHAMAPLAARGPPSSTAGVAPATMPTGSLPVGRLCRKQARYLPGQRGPAGCLAETVQSVRQSEPCSSAERSLQRASSAGRRRSQLVFDMPVGGHDVLGFDLSPSAVATAREVSGYADVLAAMAEHGGAVEFTQASAVDLGGAERVQANILTLTTTLTLSLALTTLRGQHPQSRPRPNSNSDPHPHPNPDHTAQARAKELGGFAGTSHRPAAPAQLYSYTAV